MNSSTHRNRHIAFWVEKAAHAVQQARATHGDAAVDARIDDTISREDAATTARVLRILSRDLGDKPTDLNALDERLRAIAGIEAPPTDSALDDAASGTHPSNEQPSAERRVPPAGLRRDLLPPRRRRSN